MKAIDDYLKKYTDEISFIELKDSRALNIEGYSIDDNTPLPVLTEDLVDEIKDGNLDEEIKISHIVEGIIFILGVDSDFKYTDEYMNILDAYDKDINDYIFFKGIRNIESGNYDFAAIYFKALKKFDPKNINGIFNYALALERIAKSFFTAEDDETGLEFIKQSTSELESILNIDDSFPLAYYKLGYHYKFYQQYLKARITWDKYLLLDKNELRLQEIRMELENIENDVILETGLTYLSMPDFDKALDEFLKLLPKLEKWWELNYLLGLSYKGLTDYNKAIEYFKIALDQKNDVAEVYNELGITYILIGEIDDAIGVFNDGLEEIQDDYRLFFNRGLAYLQLDKINQAYDDIKKAAELNPNDENISLQKQKLEELI